MRKTSFSAPLFTRRFVARRFVARRFSLAALYRVAFHSPLCSASLCSASLHRPRNTARHAVTAAARRGNGSMPTSRGGDLGVNWMAEWMSPP